MAVKASRSCMTAGRIVNEEPSGSFMIGNSCEAGLEAASGNLFLLFHDDAMEQGRSHQMSVGRIHNMRAPARIPLAPVLAGGIDAEDEIGFVGSCDDTLQLRIILQAADVIDRDANRLPSLALIVAEGNT